MDYHAIHGQDVSSFDLDATHRLPTVSAAQASADLRDRSRIIPAGLAVLDVDGVNKGELTEIWGPPGSGKTAFGLQLAAEVLGEGRRVVWVDGFHPVCIQRLAARIRARREDKDRYASCSEAEQLASFMQYTCPSLPHFLALLCRPTAKSVPENTGLVIVDSLSSLVNHAFPRATDPRRQGKGGHGSPLANRRFPILEYMSTALQKLAATRNLAVVILTQCATRMQADQGAVLIPAINAVAWDHGISTRIALFRDWVWNDDRLSGAHLAGILKTNGRTDARLSIARLAAFRVDAPYIDDSLQTGLVPIDYDGAQPRINMSLPPARKRKLADADLEIGDSDDEYGWQEEDVESLPRMPPQWQGSEDILLGQGSESEGDAAPESEVVGETNLADPDPDHERAENH